MSSRPNLGEMICVAARPAATQAPAQREHVTLADCLLNAAFHWLLALAIVRVAAHERLADEARHLVVRQRARGLERSRAEDEKVECGMALRVAAPSMGDRSGGAEATREHGQDRCISGVGRPVGLDNHRG